MGCGNPNNFDCFWNKYIYIYITAICVNTGILETHLSMLLKLETVFAVDLLIS